MINKLADGWTYTVTHGAGTITKQTTDPDLHRHVFVELDVTSAALRLRHPGGRRAVGVWCDGKFDLAFAWCATTDRPDDTPTSVKSTGLKAWISTPLLDLVKAELAPLAVAA